MPCAILTFLCLITITSISVSQASAQEAFGEVVSSPICFNIKNEADYSVFGRVMSNYFVRADGVKTRHRSTFRLSPGAWREVCTTGPFFEGRQVELVLQTLVPIFDCKTAITGDIIIRGERTSDGTTKTWAECIHSDPYTQ